MGTILKEGGLRLVKDLRTQGQKVVLAFGVFDLLRVGHTRYLREAKGLGDILVLALASDDSIQRTLGPGRPLLPLEDRIGILAAFEMVDFVTSYSEDDVVPFLNALKPDVLACQGDAPQVLGGFPGKVVLLGHSGDEEAEQLIQVILKKYSDPNTKINE
ncbi:MAG TPA: adenylyltransferase/cytidyltransferase family protein [bacterium]|nr:adenylyltransferase/cytidyltransferase family protein [bacterium]